MMFNQKLLQCLLKISMFGMGLLHRPQVLMLAAFSRTDQAKNFTLGTIPPWVQIFPCQVLSGPDEWLLRKLKDRYAYRQTGKDSFHFSQIYCHSSEQFSNKHLDSAEINVINKLFIYCKLPSGAYTSFLNTEQQYGNSSLNCVFTFEFHFT